MIRIETDCVMYFCGKGGNKTIVALDWVPNFLFDQIKEGYNFFGRWEVENDLNDSIEILTSNRNKH